MNKTDWPSLIGIVVLTGSLATIIWYFVFH